MLGFGRGFRFPSPGPAEDFHVQVSDRIPLYLFSRGFRDVRRWARVVKRSGTKRAQRRRRATAQISVASPNRADLAGATICPLRRDHLGGLPYALT